jgi:hypothetical protein
MGHCCVNSHYFVAAVVLFLVETFGGLDYLETTGVLHQRKFFPALERRFF